MTGYIEFSIVKLWNIILIIPKHGKPFFLFIATLDQPVKYTLWMAACQKGEQRIQTYSVSAT